jgi:hypothetical protein
VASDNNNNNNNNNENSRRSNNSGRGVGAQSKKRKLADGKGKEGAAGNVRENLRAHRTTPGGGSSLHVIPDKRRRQTTLQFSCETNEHTLDQVEKLQAKIQNGGRAEVESRFAQSLQWAKDQCRRVQRGEEVSSDDGDTDCDDSLISSLNDLSDLQDLTQNWEDPGSLARSQDDGDAPSPGRLQIRRKKKKKKKKKKNTESPEFGFFRASVGELLADDPSATSNEP